MRSFVQVQLGCVEWHACLTTERLGCESHWLQGVMRISRLLCYTLHSYSASDSFSRFLSLYKFVCVYTMYTFWVRRVTRQAAPVFGTGARARMARRIIFSSTRRPSSVRSSTDLLTYWQSARWIASQFPLCKRHHRDAGQHTHTHPANKPARPVCMNISPPV